jgi:ABC-type glycerol-3-phosphate transport system substrate-binding protein
MATARFRSALRLMALLSILLASGLMATACGRNNNQANTGRQPQLRVWRVNQEADVIRDIADDFVRNNKDLQYTYRNVPSLEGYELLALKSLTARNGPDVWSVPNDWLGDHVSRLGRFPEDYFEAEAPGSKAPERVKVTLAPGIAEQIVINDRLYGMPTGVDVLRLYINAELFSQARTDFRRSLGDRANDEQYQPVNALLSRAPRTWNELTEQVKYITRRDGITITRSAIALGAADNAPNTADVLQLLIMQNGGNITSTDRNRALFHIPVTSPSDVDVRPGENALDFLTSFSNPSKPTYTWNPSMPQAIDAFGQGRVAMVIAFADFEQELKQRYPRMEYTVAPAPQITVAQLQPQVDLIRFWVETVPRVTDNPVISLAFVKELARNADSIARQARLGSPFLRTLQNDPETFPNKQILNGRAVYKKHREQFDQTFRQMIIDVSQNGLTPSQALDSGAEKINRLLATEDE